MLDNMEPGGDGTKGRWWTKSRGLADADKRLFLIFCLVLLIMPSKINLVDQIRMLEGISEGIAMSACPKKFCQKWGRRSGCPFGWVLLERGSGCDPLGPLREAKTGVNPSDKPIHQGMVDGEGGGGDTKWALVVDHFDGEGFTAIMHFFPLLDFVETGHDFRCPVDGTMWAKRV